MVYVTSDTHGEFERLSEENLKKQGIEIAPKDYIVVCGDLGLCWEKGAEFEKKCEELKAATGTFLWVQGNHENYDMISEYPIELWKGGKVRHIIKDKVILLERGQVFQIEGKKFFTFGGARSNDQENRTEHIDWWKEELPSEEEMQESFVNLSKHDYQVDYVITHCAPSEIMKKFSKGTPTTDYLTDYLDQINKKTTFKMWFFGHHHREIQVDEKHRMIYHEIERLS